MRVRGPRDVASDAGPDHDGVPNGVEYVLGGNPKPSATPGSPTATLSGGDLHFTFPRQDASETEGIALASESSMDLLTWQTSHHIGHNCSTFGVTISENGDAPDTITVAIPLSPEMARFARRRVTIAE